MTSEHLSLDVAIDVRPMSTFGGAAATIFFNSPSRLGRSASTCTRCSSKRFALNIERSMPSLGVRT
ncbi:hypothetical protein SERLA73DRAFT_189661 [Serpula lacrymans var. lacrymans S7.3]|uniref:Uncharacterized protein n=1 Tax=Serpula lacrymans var. lacrymans (strain S7.3) TaxID=936435 RepID=F8QEC0_SERL3|nr:hypothetical protein SERLA73DRAFT_189661 [Serpula lacrymans var. lacrymans S7.3]